MSDPTAGAPTITCTQCFSVAFVANDDWIGVDQLRPLLPDGWSAQEITVCEDSECWECDTFTEVICPRCNQEDRS